MLTILPRDIDDILAAVGEHGRVVPHGAQTKRPLIGATEDAVRLDMTGLTGVTQYEPAEFTFTARAGTRLTEIESLLAAHDQYLPFDPPLAKLGATIGGTLAAGLSGPGRLRFGGVRDFIIGVRFVDGTGRLVGGGGKVVKNAAGFDLPKLMVGSMGRLGVLVELTFKVFPAPPAARTLRATCADFDDAVSCIARLCRLPLELDALELEPPATLVLRVAGDDGCVGAHAERVGAALARSYEVLSGDAADSYWRIQSSFEWVGADHLLIKVPLSIARVAALENALAVDGIHRRYSVAANVAWLAWPADRPLAALDLAGTRGLVVRGPHHDGVTPLVGSPNAAAAGFAHRVKEALDPDHRLPPLN